MSLHGEDLDFYEEEGSAGRRGQIWGGVALAGHLPAYLDVKEFVVVESGGLATREEYHYFLVIDGEEIFGFELDPTHTPALHCHGRAHKRDEAEEISFEQVVELAWDTVTEAELVGLDELDPIGVSDREPL